MKIVLYALGKKFDSLKKLIDWSDVVAVSDMCTPYEIGSFYVPFVSSRELLGLEYDYIIVFSDVHYEEIRMYLVWECFIEKRKVISWRGLFPQEDEYRNVLCKWISENVSSGMVYSILDYGRAGLTRYYLTKNDICSDRDFQLCGMDIGDGDFNLLLYDEILSPRSNNEKKFQFAVLGEINKFTISFKNSFGIFS